MYIYIYIYLHICVCVYIYIYIDRGKLFQHPGAAGKGLFPQFFRCFSDAPNAPRHNIKAQDMPPAKAVLPGAFHGMFRREFWMGKMLTSRKKEWWFQGISMDLISDFGFVFRFGMGFPWIFFGFRICFQICKGFPWILSMGEPTVWGYDFSGS